MIHFICLREENKVHVCCFNVLLNLIESHFWTLNLKTVQILNKPLLTAKIMSHQVFCPFIFRKGNIQTGTTEPGRGSGTCVVSVPELSVTI